MKECGALHILTKEYNYKVITSCDIILYGYYITDKRKSENYKKMYKNEQYKRCSRAARGSRELDKEVWKGRSYSWSACSAISLILDGRIHVSPSYKIWTFKFRGVGPTSGEMSAKWHAHTGTRVLINLNQKICIKNHVVSKDTQKQAMKHQIK